MSKYVLMRTIAGIDNGQLISMAVASSNPFTVLPGEFSLEVQDPTGLDPTPAVTLHYRYITLTNLVPGPGPGGAEIKDMTMAEQAIVDGQLLIDFKQDCEDEALKIHEFMSRLVSINPSTINSKRDAQINSINSKANIPDVAASTHGLNAAILRKKNRYYNNYFDDDGRIVPSDAIQLIFDILEYYTT